MYKDRNKRRERGLCRDCNNSVVVGCIYCANCLLKASQRGRRKRRDPAWVASKAVELKRRSEQWAREGKCYRCGLPLRDDEDRYCIACTTMRHERIGTHKKGVYIQIGGA